MFRCSSLSTTTVSPTESKIPRATFFASSPMRGRKYRPVALSPTRAAAFGMARTIFRALPDRSRIQRVEIPAAMLMTSTWACRWGPISSRTEAIS